MLRLSHENATVVKLWSAGPELDMSRLFIHAEGLKPEEFRVNTFGADALV